MGTKVPKIKELRELAKHTRRDFIYSFIDYLAYYPAKLFLYTPLTANQITIIWIFAQVIAALFLASGNNLTMLIALVIFQLMFILDCSDGIVARYLKQFSLNGVYLDCLGHYITNPLLLICYGIGVFRIQHQWVYFFLGILAALFFLLNKAITLNPNWYKDNTQKEKIECSYEGSLLQNQRKSIYFVFAFFRLEYLFNLMFWGTLFGYLHYTLIIYCLFFFIELIRKIISQFIHNYKLDKN